MDPQICLIRKAFFPPREKRGGGTALLRGGRGAGLDDILSSIVKR